LKSVIMILPKLNGTPGLYLQLFPFFMHNVLFILNFQSSAWISSYLIILFFYI
jgi:hypothetical protein